MAKIDYRTHTPEEAADHLDGLYKGDHDRYFREKLWRGYKRAAALNDLVKAGAEFEGEEVTADLLIWNQHMNTELVRRAMEDGKFDLTEEIITCFLKSWHTGKPVGMFLKKEHAEALPLYEEQRNSHRVNQYFNDMFTRYEKLNNNEISQEEIDQELDDIPVEDLREVVRKLENGLEANPGYSNADVWRASIDAYKRAIERKND